MAKTRPLVIIIVFLLITNIGMLLFFIFSGSPAEKKGYSREQESKGMSNSLQNEVGFSADQLNRYQSLRKEQREIVKPLFGELRATKKEFYGLLYIDNVSDSLITADVDSIAQKQKNLDAQMFHYFKNVRNICMPNQTQKFDSVINKVLMRMVGRQGKDNRKSRR